MSEEIENRESRGEQKPSDVVVFSPEVLAMADRRRRQKAEELETCRQAAEDGDSQAQVQMGLHYIYGTHGVERDGKKAFEWFSQTASDDPVGRYWLGVCYDNGTGVERDGGLCPGAVRPRRLLRDGAGHRAGSRHGDRAL